MVAPWPMPIAQSPVRRFGIPGALAFLAQEEAEARHASPQAPSALARPMNSRREILPSSRLVDWRNSEALSTRILPSYRVRSGADRNGFGLIPTCRWSLWACSSSCFSCRTPPANHPLMPYPRRYPLPVGLFFLLFASFIETDSGRSCARVSSAPDLAHAALPAPMSAYGCRLNRHWGHGPQCPFYPQKQTLRSPSLTSASDPQRTSVAAGSALHNHPCQD